MINNKLIMVEVVFIMAISVLNSQTIFNGSLNISLEEGVSEEIEIILKNKTGKALLLYFFSIDNPGGYSSYVQSNQPGVFIEMRDKFGKLIALRPSFYQPEPPFLSDHEDSLSHNEAHKIIDTNVVTDYRLPPLLKHEQVKLGPHETKKFSMNIEWLIQENELPIELTIYYRIPSLFKDQIIEHEKIMGQLFLGTVVSNKLIIE